MNEGLSRRLRLYAIADAKVPLALMTSLIQAGVTAIQVRDKDLSDAALLRWARAVRRVTEDGGALMIVNDRPDIAQLSKADGVHVGQDDLPVSAVRAICGNDAIVGVSCGTLAEAVQAEEDGADYVAIGSIFETPTKPDAGAPIGTDLLQRVAATCRVPRVAIGGVTPERAADVYRAGADGVAVASALLGAGSPVSAARAFGAAWPFSS